MECGEWHLTTGNPKYYKDHVVVEADDPLITIDALVQVWEQDLEAENHHSQMSMPENLVETLRRANVADDTIKRVLWDIIESQGGWM